MILETLLWHLASIKPDSDTTVLCWGSEGFFTGYWDDGTAGWIACESGGSVTDVTYWSEPSGPALAEAPTALARLQAFARGILEGWPEFGGLDGGDVQDMAIEHGLLRLKTPAPSSPCGGGGDGSACACAEYYDAADFADGSVLCYERTDLLGRAPPPSPDASKPA